MKRLLRVLIYLIMFGILVYLILLAFINPHLTNRELVITYWRQYLMSLIVILTGYFILNKL